MGIVFSDGFDSYSATADVANYKWQTVSSVASWSSNSGVTNLGALVMTSTSPNITAVSNWAGRNFNITGSLNYISHSFWFKSSAAPTSSAASPYWVFRTFINSGTAQYSFFGISSQGFAQIALSAAAPAATGTVNLCDGIAHWIEMVAANGSGAQCSLWVDGVLVLNPVLGAGGINNVNWMIFYALPNTTYVLDDLVVCSSYGAATPLVPANLPLGQRVITTLRPTADSSVSFARSSAAASNAALVNGVSKSTATYVQSATLGNDDLYTYGALPFTPASISGVVLNSYVENPSFGGILFNAVSFESSLAFGSSYNNWNVLTGLTANASFYTPGSPNLLMHALVDTVSASQWKSSNFNTATFGIRVSTASS